MACTGDATMEDPRFLYCSRCGAAAPEARSATEWVCRRCGFRHFINPVAAVAAILSNARGELLLLRRAREPGKGKLGLPGGFIDVGETAEEALRREIREEVALEVDRFEYLATLPNEYPFQGVATPVLDLFFTARLDDFSGARACVEEVAGLEVVRPDLLDYDRVAFASNARALRLFTQGRHPGRPSS